ncbi:methylenetetrahydrofolate reductase [Bacteriovoracales bacterium]|nr:methylenetetrahydrofolate reductase [Bacteriovoracales bacterium]
MKVIEHLEKSVNPSFSYEIVPPPRGRSVRDVIDVVEALEPLNPPWIDVTSHSAGAFYNEKEDGAIERRIFKKRPGTIGICGIIQNRFKIDTVTHILTEGFTREETEDALIELNYLGIHNVLALRGDGLNYKKKIQKTRSTNQFASELVSQISNLKEGIFLEELQNANSLDFCVGVAGYPEKHFEAPNMKVDLSYLKEKVENGADYIVTQMFFDNQKYFSFVQNCRDNGINVPIIPGIKVIKNIKQLSRLPRTFHVDLPNTLVDQINEAPHHIEEIGIQWAKTQVQGLLEFGVPNVHFYIMNDVESILKIVKSFI